MKFFRMASKTDSNSTNDSPDPTRMSTPADTEIYSNFSDCDHENKDINSMRSGSSNGSLSKRSNRSHHTAPSQVGFGPSDSASTSSVNSSTGLSALRSQFDNIFIGKQEPIEISQTDDNDDGDDDDDDDKISRQDDVKIQQWKERAGVERLDSSLTYSNNNSTLTTNFTTNNSSLSSTNMSSLNPISHNQPQKLQSSTVITPAYSTPRTNNAKNHNLNDGHYNLTTPDNNHSLDQNDHLTLLQRQKEQHALEIEEILQQLNSLESNYTEELNTLQESLEKKEIMCDALTQKLSEHRKLQASMQITIDRYKSEVIATTEHLQTTQSALVQAKRDLTILQQQNEEQTAVYEKSKREAVEFAQNEIRIAAEEQFASAQKQFVNLKKVYKTIKSERDMMQFQLESIQKEYDLKERKHKGELTNLMAELAEVKAALATEQAEGLKMKQSHENIVQAWMDRENEAMVRLANMEKECAEAHRLVGSVMSEKEVLKKENEELQILCEEMMGIVEGRDRKDGDFNQ